MSPRLPLLDIFDRVCIINLATRADRRREMSGQMAAIGVSWNTPGISRFDAVRPADRGDFPTIGARGCFLSHLGVLRQARDDRLDSILILEDDLDFAPDFGQRWPAISTALGAAPWSFFYGGYLVEPTMPASAEPIWTIAPQTGVQTAHFFGVRGRAIGELAAYLEAMLKRRGGDAAGGPMHVDGAYSWFRREHPAHVTLASTMQLGSQRSSRTDIHDLAWFDRWIGLREAAQQARRLRRWVKAR